MSVLVFAETQNNKIKKSSFEPIGYGRKLADLMGVECQAIIVGTAENASDAGLYGAQSVIHVNHGASVNFDCINYSKIICSVAKEKGAKVIVFSHSSSGKGLAAYVATKLSAGIVSGVNSLPTVEGQVLKVSKSVFSGKASANFSIDSEIKVITLAGNTIKPDSGGTPATIEQMEIVLDAPKMNVLSTKRQEGTVPLPEAELVVSAGRGMKDPANWNIIEDLAKTIGATTACSRPVADTGWRPHHEHVGQTGVAIRPNLYIAIGISGAIQHLAGVNNSKTIVVINKDPEAPFFKAADYGVLGDLFDVVPRLTEALKKLES